jgi:hypothetical protein
VPHGVVSRFLGAMSFKKKNIFLKEKEKEKKKRKRQLGS